MGDGDESPHRPASTPPGDASWPAERTPGRFDSVHGNRPLETSFVQSFKHALMADQGAAGTFSYLDDTNETLVEVFGPSNSRVCR